MRIINEIANWTDIKKNNIYMATCEYMAKTELFDRSLTNLRSPFDPTEAFISNGCRSISNANALKVRNDILKKYGIQSADLTKEIHKYQRYSSQRWIDEYNKLLEKNK